MIFRIIGIGLAVMGLSGLPGHGEVLKEPDPSGPPLAQRDTTIRSVQENGSIGPRKTSSKRADFKKVNTSTQTRKLADWVVDSGDNQEMPFILVDKINAMVFVFDPDGRLKGSAPALLGLAKGDHSFPGIGDRHLSAIRPEERTTPAGRFVGMLGHNSDGKNVLWVDHDKAVSLHRVITNHPEERRLERLATLTPLDNKISYGCINVPVKFFDDIVRPVFAGTRGVIYVLPEVKTTQEVFESYYHVD